MTRSSKRHELKFVVDLSCGEEFMRRAEAFTKLDQHAGQDGFYETLSIYYDSERLRFYWDRMESLGYRRKVRLRRYSGYGLGPSPAFLEIKEKHKQMVSKRRGDFDPGRYTASRVAQGGILELDRLLPLLIPSQGSDEVAYLHDRLSLMPIVNVRYLRRALVGIYDPTLRITLDKRLSASLPALCDYSCDREDLFLPPAKAVLEIKSERSVPLSVLSLVRSFEFVRARYSKYCAAVDLLRNSSRLGGRLLNVVESDRGDNQSSSIRIAVEA